MKLTIMLLKNERFFAAAEESDFTFRPRVASLPRKCMFDERCKRPESSLSEVQKNIGSRFGPGTQALTCSGVHALLHFQNFQLICWHFFKYSASCRTALYQMCPSAYAAFCSQLKAGFSDQEPARVPLCCSRRIAINSSFITTWS
jgi:hypothetical protein